MLATMVDSVLLLDSFLLLLEERTPVLVASCLRRFRFHDQTMRRRRRRTGRSTKSACSSSSPSPLADGSPPSSSRRREDGTSWLPCGRINLLANSVLCSLLLSSQCHGERRINKNEAKAPEV